MPTNIQSEQAFGMAMHNKYTLSNTKELAQHGLVGGPICNLPSNADWLMWSITCRECCSLGGKR